MQRWRHICTNRPPPDHLRATYAQPARRCVPSHVRPAMMNVIHVSQRCQRLVGNYVSAGRGFRWHLLGTNPPRTPGPQREPAASSRAAVRISRKPTHLGTKPPRASAPQHPTAAGCSVRARNRRGHARFVQIRLHPSRRPPHCRRSRASDMQRWHHICTNRPPPAPFGPHTGSPDLHGRAPPTRSRFTASIAISSATRPGTVDEITIRGPDRDLVGVVGVVGVVGSVGGAGGMSGGSPTRRAWETSARTPTSHARRASRGTRCR